MKLSLLSVCFLHGDDITIAMEVHSIDIQGQSNHGVVCIVQCIDNN